MKITVVSSPLLNYDGIIIDNVASRYLFEMVIDYDFTSLYPSIEIGFNIDATTQIGKIEFVDNMGHNPITDMPVDGSDFAGHLISKDFMNIGHKYLGIPLPSEISKDIRSGKYDHILEEAV